jgi:hypothetical protein
MFLYGPEYLTAAFRIYNRVGQANRQYLVRTNRCITYVAVQDEAKARLSYE